MFCTFMSNKNVNLSVCLPFVDPNCMHVVLALQSLLVHSILAWVACYGNDHPMQQAYSILVQSESRGRAHFVLNFVAMATTVGRGKIQLAAFDGPFPKTSTQM